MSANGKLTEAELVHHHLGWRHRRPRPEGLLARLWIAIDGLNFDPYV